MFTAPAILAGLLAIGLPLWLHRVTQANPVRHPFASLMLLETSDVQRTAKRRLRYWLLLALRILLLIALVLAFAGPLVPRQAVPVVNPDARLHAIVLDTSLSMNHGERWQRAVTQARQLIEAVGPGDQLLLVEAAGRNIEVLHHATNAQNAGVTRAALDKITPGNQRLDYGLLMSTAKGWLGEARLPVELHLISDLQQSASPLRFADLEPPEGARLVLHEVAQGPSANSYIESAARVAPDAMSIDLGTTSTLIDRREAVLSVDGKEVARRPVQIGPALVATAPREGEGSPPPGLLADADGEPSVAQARVSLPLPQLSPSAHRIEVRLEPADSLPQDDRYFTVVEHADPRVLLVSRTTDADDAVYAAAAIGSLSSPRLATEQVTGQAIESRSLQQYAAIVITDVSALSSNASARLTDYARAGGALFVMLTPGAAPQSEGLLAGLRIRNVVARPTQVTRVDSSHPVLREAAGWESVRFLKYLQLTAGPDDRVLISLQEDAPLLLERSLGAGRALILTTPLAREWNDLATHPLFVHFMAQAATYLTGSAKAATSTQVGAAVMTGLTAGEGGQIFDPQGRRVLNLNQTAAAERLIPDQAGFYEIRNAGVVRWLAVNTDVRESNLARMSDASLQRWQDLQRNTDRPPAAAISATSREPDRASIGYAMLVLGVLLAIAELLAANHFLAVRREVPR